MRSSCCLQVVLQLSLSDCWLLLYLPYHYTESVRLRVCCEVSHLSLVVL